MRARVFRGKVACSSPRLDLAALLCSMCALVSLPTRADADGATALRSTFDAAALQVTDANLTKGTGFAIDHYTIDNGGGTSTGGVFAVSGTIGQPDADPLQPSTGGVFAFTGGFWPIANVAAPPDAIFANGFEL